jgi:6,7-dimethyl-8-ribityllumazine synthase
VFGRVKVSAWYKSLMKAAPTERASARGLRIAIVRALFNPRLTDGLLAGARQALAELGADPRHVKVFDLPGAFELPLAAQAAARSGRFDAVVALGAVVQGETDHYEHIAREAAAGLAAVARETGVPIGFGVLTVRREQQAVARSAATGDNKGAEAARAAVLTFRTLQAIGARPRRSR